MSENDHSKSKIYTFVRWCYMTAIGFILLLILGLLLLRMTSVQIYLSQKVTNYLSQKTGAEISTRYIKINPFEGIVLQELTILMHDKSEILSVDNISISLRKNLFFLFSNKLDLSYFGIKGLNLHVFTKCGAKTSNLTDFIAKLPKPSRSNANSNFILDLKELELSDIHILIENQNTGKKDHISWDMGVFDISHIDLECNEFIIESAILTDPYFKTFLLPTSCDNPIKKGELTQSTSRYFPLNISLKELGLVNGNFGVSKKEATANTIKKDHFDYNDFMIEDIKLVLNDFTIRDNEIYQGRITQLEARDNTGFRLKHFSCDSILVSSESAEFTNFKLELGDTYINKSISFSFESFQDFKDFENLVFFNADFSDTKIKLNDLTHFVLGLKKSPFFKQNGNEIVDFSGRISGRVQNLTGRNVQVKMGNKVHLIGDFSVRDILDTDITGLNIKVEKLNTSFKNIKQIFPNFNPPDNFNKLGNIQFNGRFDGYLEDFVAYGKMNSDLGSASLDMRLDIKKGTQKAKYSGILNLTNFNLGKWSGNSDFGYVNFNSKVEDGNGLTLNTVNAKLKANVQSLTFKNYEYKDFIIDGILKKNTFQGDFRIEDKNINLFFTGDFEYFEDKAFLKFKSKVDNLDLFALNFTKTPFQIKGDILIDVEGISINDFTGKINVNNFMLKDSQSLYSLDSIIVDSRYLVTSKKELSVRSDIGTVNILGTYDLDNVVASIKNVLHENHEKLITNWVEIKPNFKANQLFDFNIQIKDSKNFLELLKVSNSHFTNLNLKGRLDTYRNELSVASEVKRFVMADQRYANLQFLITSNKNAGDILIHIDSSFVFDKRFNPIDIETNIQKDTISFDISTDNVIKNLEVFDIKGMLLPQKNGYVLTFKDNNLKIFDKIWKINPKNYTYFSKDEIKVDNFIVTDGFRTIELNEIYNSKGIELDATNFNIASINRYINLDSFQLSGLTNLNVKTNDVFSKQIEFEGYANLPQLYVNKKSYGSIFLDIKGNTKELIKANINIGDFLALSTTYDIRQEKLDGKGKIRSAPLDLLEKIIGSGLKDTEGVVNADVQIDGGVKNLKLNGTGIINNGKTTIEYTGVTYLFHKQKFSLTESSINLEDVEILDLLGNKGLINGQLTHNFFKNFGANINVTSRLLTGLNTKKDDNPDYYGTAIGNLNVDFIGPFTNMDIRITARTAAGTELNIPVGNSTTKIDQNFIKFVNKTDKNSGQDSKDVKLDGLNIQMALTITPEAQANIIFDETLGDIIKGRGRGNLNISVTREGRFDIFGSYEIESGEYLFTAPILFVAKPFVIERGGKITWTGDPVNANIDIKAYYKTRTSLANFIEEYNLDLQQASQIADVNVGLNLGGTLFKPEIKFSLAFPSLTGDIANFVDNKLRVLSNNDQELNGQVLGLIVFNSFLPSNRIGDIFGGSDLQSASINTLGEFLSSQLSLYITNILNSLIQEGGIVSGVDFDVNLRNNTFSNSPFVPDEIAVKNKIIFKDNRFSLDLGGNYVVQSFGQPVNQVLPDFALEFILSEEGKLKVRLYGRYDIDVINFQLRPQYGLGLGYRTEFGPMIKN